MTQKPKFYTFYKSWGNKIFHSYYDESGNKHNDIVEDFNPKLYIPSDTSKSEFT